MYDNLISYLISEFFHLKLGGQMFSVMEGGGGEQQASCLVAKLLAS